MDPFIIAWVIEFLIRHRAPPPFLNAFLTDPRSPVRQINNPRLKKSICLRNIQDEVSGGAVSSESILDLLEIIEEFDRKRETPITHSMKRAYCAVAVQCTVRYLREGDEGKFFEAVKRIWRERVDRLELLKSSELVTDELNEVKEEMEACLWNPMVSERLMGRVGESEAVGLVRDYVKEALAAMGPSFVDLAAEAEVQLNLKRKREAASQGIDLKQRRKDHGEVEMEEGNQSNADPERVVTDRPARQDGDRVETEEGSNVDTCPDTVVLDRPGSPDVREKLHIDVDEVLKVREALKRSCMELRSLVKDPLPEALSVSDSLRAEIRERSLNKETSFQNGNDTNLPTSTNNAEVSGPTTEILNPVPSQANQNTKSNAEIPMPNSQGFAPKCSLMERSSTACTFEWNESIDGTSQEAGISMDKDKLPTKSQRRNLPSFKVETAVGRKRTKRWWSVEEEDGLRDGVKKFGAGNWKLILQSKRSLFVDRKPVDLKDKWRNMTKSSECDKEHD